MDRMCTADVKAQRAKDAFQDTFVPLLESMIFNVVVFLTEKPDGSYSMSVKCQFEDLGSVSRRRKEAIRDLLSVCGGGFEFEGTAYPLSIEFVGVPVSLQE